MKKATKMFDNLEKYLKINTKNKKTFTSPLQGTLNDFNSYLLVEKGYSKNTWESYQYDLNRLLKYMYFNNLSKFIEIEFSHIYMFLESLYKLGLSAISVKRVLEACRSFFKFLQIENIISTNVFRYIPTPKIEHKLPTVLTQEEVIQIIEQPDIKTSIGLRDRAILEFLYGSGMRVSELCDLRIDDIQLDDKMVRIFGKGSKERIVPITGLSIYFLTKYWKRNQIKETKYAFSTKSKNKMSRHLVWKMVKNYSKQSGVNKNVSPHTFRHSYAVHMMNNRADIRVIQDLLGHARISTTGLYLQLSVEELSKLFKEYHPRYTGKEINKHLCDENTLLTNIDVLKECRKIIRNGGIVSTAWMQRKYKISYKKALEIWEKLN
jgi:integrase/recombinase XerD